MANPIGPPWAVAETRLLERVSEGIGVEPGNGQPERWNAALRAARVFNRTLFGPDDPQDAQLEYHDLVEGVMRQPDVVPTEAEPYARMLRSDLTSSERTGVRKRLEVLGRTAWSLRTTDDIREATAAVINHGGIAGGIIAVREAMYDVPRNQAAQFEAWVQDAYGYVYGRNVAGNLTHWRSTGVVRIRDTLENRHYMNNSTSTRTKPAHQLDYLDSLRKLNIQPTGHPTRV